MNLRCVILAIAASLTVVSGGLFDSDKTGACKALDKAYSKDTEFKLSIGYLTLNDAWASNTVLSPHCIFTPRTTEAVAFALKTFKKRQTRFAIRSGGHSMNRGFSSTDDGVQVNLHYLNEVTLNRKANTVKLGTGNTWGTVYSTLEKQGFTVAGGRGSLVGVGGLSLGGGISFYLSEYGFGCDNIVEYEVVTADGEVLIVNAQSHPELFLTLKGSGAPFVLVTKFTYKLIKLDDPSGNMYGGMIYSEGSAVSSSIDAIVDYMGPDGGIHDVNSHFFSVIGYVFDIGFGSLGSVSGNTFFYRKPSAEMPPALKGLEAASKKALTASTIGNRTISSITEEVLSIGNGLRQIMFTWTVANPTREVLHEIERITREDVAPVMRQAFSDLSITLNLIPMGSTPAKIGNNIMGLDKSGKTTYLSASYVAVWLLSMDDKRVEEALRYGYENSIAYLKEKGHYSPFIYLNYAAGSQDPISSYGEENIKKLREVQQRYDPDRMWEKLIKGGFKIPRA